MLFFYRDTFHAYSRSNGTTPASATLQSSIPISKAPLFYQRLSESFFTFNNTLIDRSQVRICECVKREAFTWAVPPKWPLSRFRCPPTHTFGHGVFPPTNFGTSLFFWRFSEANFTLTTHELIGVQGEYSIAFNEAHFMWSPSQLAAFPLRMPSRPNFWTWRFPAQTLRHCYFIGGSLRLIITFSNT